MTAFSSCTAAFWPISCSLYKTFLCDNFYVTVQTRKIDEIFCDQNMCPQTGALVFMRHIKIVKYNYLIVCTTRHIKCDKCLEKVVVLTIFSTTHPLFNLLACHIDVARMDEVSTRSNTVVT